MASKERISPPTRKELKDASKQLRGGHSSGGRTMADQSVARRQGVAPRENQRASGGHAFRRFSDTIALRGIIIRR